MVQVVNRELGDPFWVYIVDEHEVYSLNPDTGKQEYAFTVTAEDLQKTADKGNQRIEDSGDYSPIICGHTVDGLPEQHQPEIVGYAGPYRVTRFFDTDRMAIQAQFRYFRDIQDEIKVKYPRRSVEVRWGDNLIDPIAVLGATTPARDLGLSYSHALVHGANKPYCPLRGRSLRYEMAATPTGMTLQPGGSGVIDQATMETFLAAFEQSALGQAIKTLVDERQNRALEAEEARKQSEAELAAQTEAAEAAKAKAAQETQAAAHAQTQAAQQTQAKAAQATPPTTVEKNAMATSTATATNTTPPSAEEREKAKNRAKYYHERAAHALEAGETEDYLHCSKMAKAELSRYDAARSDPVSVPGATAIDNDSPEDLTPVPGASATTQKVESLDARGSTPEKMRMQMEQQTIALTRYEHLAASQAEEIRKLKIRNQRADRERDLVQLEAEGVVFDRATELDDVQDMTDEQFNKHKERMKTRYAKAPFGVTIPTSTQARTPTADQSRRAQVVGDPNLRDRAVAKAEAEGTSYGEALRALQAGSNGSATV